MTCPHNTYNGKSNIVDCICPKLEDGKQHMIFKEGVMSKENICPLKFGKIETEVKDGNLIIKERKV